MRSGSPALTASKSGSFREPILVYLASAYFSRAPGRLAFGHTGRFHAQGIHGVQDAEVEREDLLRVDRNVGGAALGVLHGDGRWLPLQRALPSRSRRTRSRSGGPPPPQVPPGSSTVSSSRYSPVPVIRHNFCCLIAGKPISKERLTSKRKTSCGAYCAARSHTTTPAPGWVPASRCSGQSTRRAGLRLRREYRPPRPGALPPGLPPPGTVGGPAPAR